MPGHIWRLEPCVNLAPEEVWHGTTRGQGGRDTGDTTHGGYVGQPSGLQKGGLDGLVSPAIFFILATASQTGLKIAANKKWPPAKITYQNGGFKPKDSQKSLWPANFLFSAADASMSMLLKWRKAKNCETK